MRGLALAFVALLLACRPPPAVPPAEAFAEAPAPAAPVGPTALGGNHRIRSFDAAKRILVTVYASHRVDLYCGCTFAPDAGRGFRVDLEGCGYSASREPSRAARIEWEHAVAASAFGHTFQEWTTGDDRCVDRKGKRFHGRRCAETSPEFARMEGDLHNLFPVVGEVNALRGDLPMGMLDPPERAPARHASAPDTTFGACKSTIAGGVFFPRPEVRGDVARAALYMAAAYPHHLELDPAHRALFMQWSVEDPPDTWERERNRAIASAQGNVNPFIDATAE